MSVPDPVGRLSAFAQGDAYSSPWTLRARLGMALWCVAWRLTCRWTPKVLYPWRALILRLFGARITGRPFVASDAVIKIPWNLVLEDRACLGPGCVVYNLGPITVRARATVAQDVYLCAGTHDFADPALPLVVGPIEIGADAFIGARAFVLPGVVIGAGAVIGAAALVSRDAPPWMICAGNPCKPIKPRPGAERFPSYHAGTPP